MRTLSFAILLSIAAVLTGCNETEFLSSTPGRTQSANLTNLRAKAINIVRNGLTDEFDLVKSSAIEIVSTTNRKELMPMVTRLLKSETIGVRFAATVAIGDMNYSAGQYNIKRLLKDKNENIRIAAAYSITKLGRKNLTPVILRALKSKDTTAQANAALLLGKLGDRKNIKALYDTINNTESFNKVTFQAIESIAMLGDERAYHKLWALLISKYADDRVVGIKGMGALGTADAQNAIITMLDDDVYTVRLAAAEQLGHLGETTGEVEVIEFLTKTSNTMDSIPANQGKMLAAMAIGRIGTESLKNFLPELLASKSKMVRLGAAQAVLLLTE